jgi:hypothetical protein
VAALPIASQTKNNKKNNKENKIMSRNPLGKQVTGGTNWVCIILKRRILK